MGLINPRSEVQVLPPAQQYGLVDFVELIIYALGNGIVKVLICTSSLTYGTPHNSVENMSDFVSRRDLRSRFGKGVMDAYKSLKKYSFSSIVEQSRKHALRS